MELISFETINEEFQDDEHKYTFLENRCLDIDKLVNTVVYLADPIQDINFAELYNMYALDIPEIITKRSATTNDRENLYPTAYKIIGHGFHIMVNQIKHKVIEKILAAISKTLHVAPLHLQTQIKTGLANFNWTKESLETFEIEFNKFYRKFRHADKYDKIHILFLKAFRIANELIDELVKNEINNKSEKDPQILASEIRRKLKSHFRSIKL
ncbi:hypothetical protein COEREDRAFT_87701 [Coemansia reversa NRRL 1564]|uniref:Uncharacterized protein n=1 Tax=Coemansia reversa (strain ATCC 12441 / NRRL 1564) TaxID=763665 RepID=A0A2G5B917_COERN|nr:hypothetical protein COEREDRAFT_87701 [Coemansia reversa NRRL 1564]|eukprot:PIA15509.1 hypothetical protein COEREDRAFT_87701 [Coemansia reversa NRRL 1564]